MSSSFYNQMKDFWGSALTCLPLWQRQSRRDRDERSEQTDDFPWETAESRPLVTSKSIEYGEDYWIDERDLEKAQLREQAIKNRKVSDLIGALLRHPK